PVLSHGRGAAGSNAYGAAADPGPPQSVAVPDQRRHSASKTRVTALMAPLRFALRRIRDTQLTLPAVAQDEAGAAGAADAAAQRFGGRGPGRAPPHPVGHP